jgi:hypothetical protein
MTVIKKNNLFGRRNRYFHLFLQNLKLKKNKNLFNRNLIRNYFYYNFFIKSLKKNKTNFLLRSLFFVNNNKILINPLFLFKKKLFNTEHQYNEFLKKNELRGLFFSKKFNNTLLNNYNRDNFGLNYFLIQNKDITNKFIESLNSDECKDIIKLKFYKNDIISYYNLYNYNIFMFNLLEIYNFIIILNLLKTIN